MNWLLNLFRRKPMAVIEEEWHVWRDWKARPTPQDHKYGESAQAAAERFGYERFDYCERS